MIISNIQMDEMHNIQLEILKNVISVCEKLGLRYFLVHGSLLGAIKLGKFMPLDDDIDLAMPRADYERLMDEGGRFIDGRYFIQCGRTDNNYPLEFAKVRDINTTYIAEPCKNIEMNHGVFIDIFPIDYVEKRVAMQKAATFIGKVLGVRIGCVLHVPLTTKRRVLQTVAKILVPSWKTAVVLNEKLNKRVTKGDYVKLTGGKPAEKCIPAKWFSNSSFVEFEGVLCAVPADWHEYLTRIYGNYNTRTLLEEKSHSEDRVEINAYILDLSKPYSAYEGENSGKVARSI